MAKISLFNYISDLKIIRISEYNKWRENIIKENRDMLDHYIKLSLRLKEQTKIKDELIAKQETAIRELKKKVDMYEERYKNVPRDANGRFIKRK